MSLVLEALRRQQADREHDPAAAMLLSSGRGQRPRAWIAVLVLALLLNAGVIAWIFLVRTPGHATATVDATPVRTDTQAAVEAAPAGSSDPDSATVNAPTDGASGAAAATVAAETAVAPTAAPPPLRTIVERLPLSALPASVRNRFPGIAFSTHIYAEDPELRAIVANGERLQEGDRVRDMLIREITEDGVILEFEDYLVEVPVFTDW